MNKQVPEMQSILAGRSLQVFFAEKKQNVICASFGPFKQQDLGSQEQLCVKSPCAHRCAHTAVSASPVRDYPWLLNCLISPLTMCKQHGGRLPAHRASELKI